CGRLRGAAPAHLAHLRRRVAGPAESTRDRDAGTGVRHHGLVRHDADQLPSIAAVFVQRLCVAAVAQRDHPVFPALHDESLEARSVKNACVPVVKMHEDELETDEDLVRRLLAAQFPQWAELPLRALPFGGTDNAIYRL